MSDATANPIFEACETKRGPDWSVLVTWPDQREQYLDGFGSFDETVAWVKDRSQAWLEAQQVNACPSAPRRHDHIWSRFEGPASAETAGSPELREVGAIDQLINVLDTHRETAKEDRRSRGDAFKDEQSSE